MMEDEMLQQISSDSADAARYRIVCRDLGLDPHTKAQEIVRMVENMKARADNAETALEQERLSLASLIEAVRG